MTSYRIEDCVSNSGAAMSFSIIKSSVEIYNCTFSNNIAKFQGGAVLITGTENENFNMTSSKFYDNDALQQSVLSAAAFKKFTVSYLYVIFIALQLL